MNHPKMDEAKAELRELLATMDALELQDHSGHPNAVALGEAAYSISSEATQRAIKHHLDQCKSCQAAIGELMRIVTGVMVGRMEAQALPVPVSLTQVYTAQLT